MKKIIQKRMALMVVLTVLISLFGSTTYPAKAAAGVTVYPVETNIYTNVISNPGKGWLLFGTDPSILSAEVKALGTCGYARFDWCDIEPSENNFNWSLIDNAINAWAAAGKQFAFRIMAANTSRGSYEAGRWVTPQWVFNAGAQYINYNISPSDGYLGQPGNKAIPVWNDAVFKAKVQHLINAIAARYDNNPNIAFIDAGTYGNWGEQHQWPYGGYELTDSELQEHLTWYYSAFKNKQVVTPMNGSKYASVYDMCVNYGIGVRRDGIMGDSPYGAECARAFDKAPAVFEWHRSYTDMVAGGYWNLAKFWDGLYTGKPSYQGTYWGVDANTMYSQEANTMKEAANRLGYHFVIKEATYPGNLAKGTTESITLKIENKGVAPIYLDSSVKVALLDSSNRVLETKTLSGIDPFSWKPGQTITSTTSFTFSNIAGGTKIAIGLFAETSASNPNVKFAVANPLSSGWYILGQETELLSNSGFETGNATGWTSGVSMSVNTAYKYSGSYGLMISNRQATWDSVSQNIISVLNNKGKGNYDASAWMKLANGSDSYTRITIVLQTTANPNPVYYDIGATSINTSWKKLSGTVNLTWSGTLTNASIYYQTNTSLANLYLDELSLIKK